MNKRRVIIHYNKPATQQRKTGKSWWTVKHKGICHIVQDLDTGNVKLETHTQNRQPVAILRGFCKEVKIENNKAYLI